MVTDQENHCQGGRCPVRFAWPARLTREGGPPCVPNGPNHRAHGRDRIAGQAPAGGSEAGGTAGPGLRSRGQPAPRPRDQPAPRARDQPAPPAQEYDAEPRPSILSIAAPTPPSVPMIRRITMTSAGMAQRSPHTHRIAAPICWPANGGRVTPGTWSYTEYQDAWVNRLIDIASTHITMFVPIRASAWDTSGIRRRNGGEGMNCSQNSTPAAKKLPCISQMCTAWLSAARSNGAGTCQKIITTLNRVTETHGRSKNPPAARSGRDQVPRMVPRVTAWPDRPGRPSSSGCHDAPATTSVGAANISSRCWIMWTKK